jgi:hypothetical protein
MAVIISLKLTLKRKAAISRASSGYVCLCLLRLNEILSSCGWVLENPPFAQLLKNFWTFYGTRRFVVEFTRALHCSLSWAGWIQSIIPHSIYLRFTLFYSSTHVQVFLLVSLLLAFSPKYYMHSPSTHACNMPCPSYFLRRDHCNYIWRRVQIMVRLFMQLSPTSFYFIPLLTKYSPQRPVLKYLQSMFLP